MLFCIRPPLGTEDSLWLLSHHKASNNSNGWLENKNLTYSALLRKDVNWIRNHSYMRKELGASTMGILYDLKTCLVWWGQSAISPLWTRNCLLASIRESKHADRHRQQASFLYNAAPGFPFPSLPPEGSLRDDPRQILKDKCLYLVSGFRAWLGDVVYLRDEAEKIFSVGRVHRHRRLLYDQRHFASTAT